MPDKVSAKSFQLK